MWLKPCHCNIQADNLIITIITAKERVLLFMSDGEPIDSVTSIITILKDRNANLNHSVIVMTYGMGNNGKKRYIDKNQSPIAV